MGIIRRAVCWIAALFGVTTAAVALFAAIAPTGNSAEQADLIVVLGAGLSADGQLHQASRLRVARGVELWKQGRAPRLHFTGGVARADGLSAGEIMARLAVDQGAPVEAISFEGLSQSTLQNALFSQPMLKDARRLILVTEGFHLPRSWLSFRWASALASGPPKIHLSHSERFRSGSPDSPFAGPKMLLREALAIWFNLARAALYDAASLFGIPADMRADWLA